MGSGGGGGVRCGWEVEEGGGVRCGCGKPFSLFFQQS